MDDSLYFAEQHLAVRDMVRTFAREEVAPVAARHDADATFPWENVKRMGELGLLGMPWPEELGGAGLDLISYMIAIHEMAKVDASHGITISAHTTLGTSPIVYFGTDAQKQKYVPALATGRVLGGFGLTEEGAGSDAGGTKTTAVRKNDHYVLNGSKTFISNGILSDLVIVVARTDPDAGHKGISLLVVERGMKGFERGRNLDKIGQHAQDTAELFFDDVEVPKENLLGEEGGGFLYLMTNLSQERLSIAVTAVSACELVLDECLKYVKERTAFGKPIGKFQHTRFTIAEMATETHIARVFIDDCIKRHLTGDLDASTASMAKWWTTELQKRVVDQGVQLFGGYGYMLEYPIAKAFVNSRVQTIYGGTTEIQKEIIGRSLGL